MDSIWARHAGTWGNKSRMVFDLAQTTIIAILLWAKFCWYFDALIQSYKNIEIRCLSGGKKRAIFQPGQSSEAGGLAVVVGKRIAESLMDAFIEQNAHLEAG